MDGVKNVTDPEKLKGFEAGFGAYGTAAAAHSMLKAGFLPTKNFQTGTLENGINLSGVLLIKSEIFKGRDTCFGCSVRCKRVIDIPGKVDPKYGGPEYETIGSFGSSCGNSDMETVCICNQLCNMYGLDTISAGMTIAFAIDCFENEVIGLDKTDGLELNWDNYKVLPVLLEKIAKREPGIGNVLAEGTQKAAEQFGPEALKLAMTVKSQEIPMHDPRMKPGLGVVYSVNPFGADHNTATHDNDQTLTVEKIKQTYESQKFYSVSDVLCLCNFCYGPAWQLYKTDDIIALCKAGIGWDVTAEELAEIGERKINMMRAFNAREGFTKKEDTMPERFFQPMPEGPSQGITIDKAKFEEVRSEYYKIAGWDEKTGNPTEEKLNKLGLGWIK
jgi:aldehyde:ferredoxin oxidoreductase